MKTLCVPAFVILMLISAVTPLAAHHSWPITYDRLVTVKGTVTEFKWANPHPMMTLDVQGKDGRWRNGWSAGPRSSAWKLTGGPRRR